jgi:predicted O-methyltransferase YrrM
LVLTAPTSGGGGDVCGACDAQGYSATALALALPPEGTLVACEKDAAILEVARGYFVMAGVEQRVDCRAGPAADTLNDLLSAGGEGTYDLVYIDADKRGYAAYFEQSLRLVRQGGLVLLDNVLWYGKVADDAVEDKQTVALRTLNDALVQDARVDFTLLPIGDGLALCRKRLSVS